ncbi:hypothetical protein [uncultured Sphingomonas sp.]|uniref:Y-family DNA polymerase n=1 Tax=uncultured Sphingomonas sp. TaxID=158754 RepID=UPI0025EFEE34|nr:hypothetical protein [uncultured Sphingomonas sp.]
MREMGRRSEAAEHPFKGRQHVPLAATIARVGIPETSARPLLLWTQTGNKQLITAACPAALALGLVPGMAVTQARALVPDLDIRPADPAADAAVLEQLTLHAVRHWSPTAAVSGPDGIWFDLTGVTHLFGGEQRFCARVLGFCRRLGLSARIAIAATPGAAHALARFADLGSVAGVVRAWEAQKATGVRLIAGTRVVLDDSRNLLLYPTDRSAWSRLSRLLNRLKTAVDGSRGLRSTVC